MMQLRPSGMVAAKLIVNFLTPLLRRSHSSHRGIKRLSIMNKIWINLFLFLCLFSLCSHSADSSPRGSRTIYAIVEPAAYYSGWGQADMANIVIEAYYLLRYESIFHYTLGGETKFYDSLEEAKAHYCGGKEIIKQSRLNDFKQRKMQNAIIELELDMKESIIACKKMYQIRGFDIVIATTTSDPERLERRKFLQPQWQYKEIMLLDFSSGALNEINTQFSLKGFAKESFETQH